jgi:hypothetical protein
LEINMRFEQIRPGYLARLNAPRRTP